MAKVTGACKPVCNLQLPLCPAKVVLSLIAATALQVSILFEVEDLSQASPATVSRAGMIYLNVEDLGWQPFITSWLQRKSVRPQPTCSSSSDA